LGAISDQQQQGWGAKVIDRLAPFSRDEGILARNLKYEGHLPGGSTTVQQVVAQIHEGHNNAESRYLQSGATLVCTATIKQG